MLLIDITPLRHPNFRRLYLSQFISLLGSQMTMITIPFQIYAITNSTFQTGLVSAIELVCLVSTALWGGVIADRFERRGIIIRAEIAMMVVVSLLAVNAYLASPSIWLIYFLAGISAGINGFHRPAFEALTPQLIPKGEMAKVSSLISFKFVAASLVGPTIAGYLVATVGSMTTYIVDAASFAISLSFLLSISGVDLSVSVGERLQHSIVKEVAAGWRYILSRKDVLASYLVDFFAMVFCMPQVLFPAFAKFYSMEKWLGALYMSIALGGLVATLASGWTLRVKRLGIAIACAAAGWSLAIFFVGVLPVFWILFVGFFVAGACDSYSGIFRMTLWNESISENYRGRIASFSMLSYSSGPLLGNAIMGFLGDAIGLHAALAFGGCVSLVMISLAVILLPQFRNYRSTQS